MGESKISKLFVLEIVLGVLWLFTLGVDIVDTLASSVVGAFLIGYPKTKAGWCEEGDVSEECQNGPVSLFLLSQVCLAIPVAIHTLFGIAVSSLQFRKRAFIITKMVLQIITLVLSLVVFVACLAIAFIVNSPDHPLGPSTELPFLIWGVSIGVVFFVLKVPSFCLYVAILVLSHFVIAEDRKEAALRKSSSESKNSEDDEEMEEHDIEMQNEDKGRNRADSNASNSEGREGDEGDDEREDEDRSHRRHPPRVPSGGRINEDEEEQQQQSPTQEEQEHPQAQEEEEEEEEEDPDAARERYEEMRRQASMQE